MSSLLYLDVKERIRYNDLTHSLMGSGALLKGGGIEAIAENGSPANDILSGSQLLYIPFLHKSFDFVLHSGNFGLDFRLEVFQFLQFPAFGFQFVNAHDESPFHI